MYSAYALLVAKALLRDRMVYVLLPFPWVNKFNHTGTIKPNYVQSPSKHMLQGICMCVCVRACVRACVRVCVCACRYGGVKALTRCCDIHIYIIHTVSFYTLC